MPTNLTRRLIAGTAGLAAATTLAMASPAAALTTRSQPTTTAPRTTYRPPTRAVFAPPGYNDPSDSEYCTHMVLVANMLLIQAHNAYDKGDVKGAYDLVAAADAIAGQGNYYGCTITTLE